MNRLNLSLLLAAGALLLSPLHAAKKKVVMISIDGLRGTTLASLPGRKLQTPNLNEMVERGAVSAGLIGVFPTVTYPSHTALVTGHTPAQHGIFGNNLFDPERKMNGAWYWYAEQIKLPALWDAAHARGMKVGAVSWPVSVGAAIDWNFPEYRVGHTMEDRMLWRSLCTPGLLSEFESKRGTLPLTGMTDEHRASMAAYLIETRKPDLMLIHLFDMDHDEHTDGPDSPLALKTLEKIDSYVGMIRKAVDAAGLTAQTDFVVVSDHGFWPVAKAFHPNAVISSLGLGAPDKQSDQWRVGVHSNGGSFALVARDPKDQDAIQLATQVFGALEKDGRWGIDHVLTGQELKQSGGYPDAFLAVSLQSGFTTGGALTGPWVTSSGATHGMHGYLPGPAELDASFAAFGPGIAAKRLPRARLVDAGPTVAEILGVTLGKTEGKSLLTQ